MSKLTKKQKEELQKIKKLLENDPNIDYDWSEYRKELERQKEKSEADN